MPHICVVDGNFFISGPPLYFSFLYVYLYKQCKLITTGIKWNNKKFLRGRPRVFRWREEEDKKIRVYREELKSCIVLKIESKTTKMKETQQIFDDWEEGRAIKSGNWRRKHKF